MTYRKNYNEVYNYELHIFVQNLDILPRKQVPTSSPQMMYINKTSALVLINVKVCGELHF